MLSRACSRTRGLIPRWVTRVDVILEAIALAGFRAGNDVYLGLDVASSEFYADGTYNLASEGKRYDSAGFTELLASWVDQYPILTVEDGMAEGDWEGWKLLTDRLGERVQLVGDDLFVTNPKILREGIDKGIANSILIKFNQIGTLTETLELAFTLGPRGQVQPAHAHRGPARRRGRVRRQGSVSLAVACE